MATEADIPSGLTDDEKAYVFQFLDAQLNSMILLALLHGMYTGILAVTLWNIFTNKCWQIRCVLVVVIILLHALITIGFAADWSFVHSAFIEKGKGFWAAYLDLDDEGQAAFLVQSITASMSTIVTDLYMIWCCWMVWGRRWPVVLIPILSLITATGKVTNFMMFSSPFSVYPTFCVVSKIFEVYRDYINEFNTAAEILVPLYTAFILATTLWCTVLIIYRILTVTGVRYGAGSRLRVYHRFIEVLVESSALYSISLIVFLAVTICNNFGLVYLDVIAGIAKGVAPTLLIGRAAAGHTRPNDDYDESTVSSLQFQAPSEVGMTSFQESTTESAILETDIEAQQEWSDELVVVVERHDSVQDETLN
ncbi:uncharacterized protein ARMOST_22072 [Armillaria ostoyae]|uniref:Uncharacterized protein n=1 Tax=Armillaria ostoyae TaxID=47428 RepID=A0A284SBV0_ARMOS|nr:uncharacterized protein ARMOST_22072 [Armillaria ostoyae]